MIIIAMSHTFMLCITPKRKQSIHFSSFDTKNYSGSSEFHFDVNSINRHEKKLSDRHATNQRNKACDVNIVTTRSAWTKYIQNDLQQGKNGSREMGQGVIQFFTWLFSIVAPGCSCMIWPWSIIYLFFNTQVFQQAWPMLLIPDSLYFFKCICVLLCLCVFIYSTVDELWLCLCFYVICDQLAFWGHKQLKLKLNESFHKTCPFCS